jgi:hypothetical protein
VYAALPVGGDFAARAQKRPPPSLATPTAVCSFIAQEMAASVPQVPTMCAPKSADALQYELSVFSPTDVLEGKMRRAWSTALFLTAQALYSGGALNHICEQSPAKRWSGCRLDVSDSYLSQNDLYYWLWTDPIALSEPSLDPSSDGWYFRWWELLMLEKKTSDPRAGSKMNAESRGQAACKDYVRAVSPDALLIMKSVPTCSVLWATDSKMYAVVDFSNGALADFENWVEPLPSTFGQTFQTSAYAGAVIFRSPWSQSATPTRAYEMYPLRDIEFSWEEANSGVRDRVGAAFMLAGQAEAGQTDRFSFGGSQPRGGGTVMRLAPTPGTSHITVDLTDGSEWTASTGDAVSCGLTIGREIILLVSTETPPKSIVFTAASVCEDVKFLGAW